MIAIPSSEGKTVDLHFGHADGFYIFTKEDDTLVFNKRVEVTPLSTGDKNHAFDQQRFSQITDALQGCSTLYCAKIGEKPL